MVSSPCSCPHRIPCSSSSGQSGDNAPAECDESDLRDQEQNILQLGEELREKGKAKEMSNLITQVKPTYDP